MPIYSFLEANRHGAARRPRFRKLCLELLEDRLAPAHLQLVNGGIGFQAMASATGGDSQSAQQLVTDLQTTQNLSDQASTSIPGSPPTGGTVGTISGSVGVIPGNLTNEGVDNIILSAFGQGDLTSESLLGEYSAGTSSGTLSPNFGTPAQVQIVPDAGDKLGQAVTIHMNSQLTGTGTADTGSTAPFNYSVSAVAKGRTISGINGSFNPLDGAAPGTIRDSSQKTFTAKIGDTFSLTISLTSSAGVSSPDSFSAGLTTLFFITPPTPPMGGLTWNKNSKAGGGFNVVYAVPQDMPLEDGSTLGYYWASGPDISNILNASDDPAHMQPLTADQEAPGNHQITIPASMLGTPPEGTMDLIVTIDPPGAPGSEPIGNLLASPTEILTNSVRPFIDSSDPAMIHAEFQPEGGALTLDQAAAIIGVDHFNWQQTYTDPSNVQNFIGTDVTVAQSTDPKLADQSIYSDNPLVNLPTMNASGQLVPSAPTYSDTTDSHSAGAPVVLEPPSTLFDGVVRGDQQEWYFAEIHLPNGGVEWSDIPGYISNPLPTYIPEINDPSKSPSFLPDKFGRKDAFTLQFVDRPSGDANEYSAVNGVAKDGFFTAFETSLVGVKGTQVLKFTAPHTSFSWRSNAIGKSGGATLTTQVTFPGEVLPTISSGGVFDVLFDDGTPVPPPFVADAIGVARTSADGVSATEILDSHGTGSFTPSDPVLSFGLATDTFISGDWTGTGTSKIGIVRPDGNGSLLWVLDSVGDGVYRPAVDLVYHFGLPGDQILVGDWAGDGKAKIGVARPNGQGGLIFSLDTNGDGVFDPGDQVILNFGLAGDQIIVGDWNGDGKAKIGVARADGVTSDIALDTNGDGQFNASDQVFQYGLAGDKFIAGDWNASGFDKIGSYRPDGLGSLLFSLDTNGDGQFNAQDQTFHFGLASDAVLTGKWQA